MGIMKDIHQSITELCVSCDNYVCEGCKMSILSRDRNGKLIRVWIKDKEIYKITEPNDYPKGDINEPALGTKT